MDIRQHNLMYKRRGRHGQKKSLVGWQEKRAHTNQVNGTTQRTKVEKGMVGWHEPTDGNRVIGISGSSPVNLLCEPVPLLNDSFFKSNFGTLPLSVLEVTIVAFTLVIVVPKRTIKIQMFTTAGSVL